MMFAWDAATALGLLALAAGTALLMASGKEGQCCKIFGKVVAYITIVASILTLLCTSYYGIRYWVDGYFEYPHGMGMKYHGEMKCPMMEHGMGGPGMMHERMEHRGPHMEGMGPHGGGMMGPPEEKPAP